VRKKKLDKICQKYLESFETWCLRKTGDISLIDHMKNEKCYKESRKKSTIYKQQNEGRLTGWVTVCIGTAF